MILSILTTFLILNSPTFEEDKVKPYLEMARNLEEEGNIEILISELVSAPATLFTEDLSLGMPARNEIAGFIVQFLTSNEEAPRRLAKAIVEMPSELLYELIMVTIKSHPKNKKIQQAVIQTLDESSKLQPSFMDTLKKTSIGRELLEAWALSEWNLSKNPKSLLKWSHQFAGRNYDNKMDDWGSLQNALSFYKKIELLEQVYPLDWYRHFSFPQGASAGLDQALGEIAMQPTLKDNREERKRIYKSIPWDLLLPTAPELQDEFKMWVDVPADFSAINLARELENIRSSSMSDSFESLTSYWVKNKVSIQSQQIAFLVYLSKMTFSENLDSQVLVPLEMALRFLKNKNLLDVFAYATASLYKTFPNQNLVKQTLQNFGNFHKKNPNGKRSEDFAKFTDETLAYLE